MMTNLDTWEIAGRDDAAALAEQSGHAVVFVADAVNGFMRRLRSGESESDAVAEFEEAGEPAVRSCVYGA